MKQIKTNLPLVAIIGRVNVGKSTLFNKLIEKHQALMSRIPGTTRDLNYGVCEWQGKEIEVVDTGGIFETNISGSDKQTIDEQIEKKTREAIDVANMILFVVDAKDGILKDDRLIANLVKKSGKPYLLVVNKIDKTKFFEIDKFKKLGLGEVASVAAISGVGVGDLLDMVMKKLPKKKNKKDTDTQKKTIKVSIIGKPNAGKSSLLNQILGEERCIVSNVPHTTREPQNTLIEYEKNKIELVDTAGIRRKSKVQSMTLESAGIAMSVKALKKSDIALFVLDISKNLSAQDAQLASLIVNSGISVIIVANKYDLINAEKDTTKLLDNYIYKYFPFLTWVPIIYVSALSGRSCQKVLKLILEVSRARGQVIDAKELNEFNQYLMKKMPPPKQPKKLNSTSKARAYISKLIQPDAPIPVFEIQVTNNIKIPESYMHYLENNIRKRFKFVGTPIKFRVKRQ